MQRGTVKARWTGTSKRLVIAIGGLIVAIAGGRADATVIYAADDGSSENSIQAGPPQPADLWWAQGFTVVPGGEIIVSIEIAFRTVPDGRAVEVLLYDDPTNDMDPTDAVLLTAVSGVTASSGTDTFVSFPIPPTAVSGDFFVGALIANLVDEFPLARDLDTSTGVVWAAENITGVGTIDPANVGGTSTLGPVNLLAFGFPGNALTRATGISAAATIPTVSEWGLIVLALLMLTAGTIIIRREMVLLAA